MTAASLAKGPFEARGLSLLSLPCARPLRPRMAKRSDHRPGRGMGTLARPTSAAADTDHHGVRGIRLPVGTPAP
jgi:hypothetical protein